LYKKYERKPSILYSLFTRFEQAHSQVEELEELLTRLQTHIDNLVGYRKELAIADEQLNKTVNLLASSEENTGLARILSRLAETHEKLAIVEKHESEQDGQQLAESFQVGQFNLRMGCGPSK